MIRMAAGNHAQGLLDTNVIILREWIDPAELPDEMAISAVTLAELSAGPHLVRPPAGSPGYQEHEERARRVEVLQRVEAEFNPPSPSARKPRAPTAGSLLQQWPQSGAARVDE